MSTYTPWQAQPRQGSWVESPGRLGWNVKKANNFQWADPAVL